jgi:hypothetical protein
VWRWQAVQFRLSCAIAGVVLECLGMQETPVGGQPLGVLVGGREAYLLVTAGKV